MAKVTTVTQLDSLINMGGGLIDQGLLSRKMSRLLKSYTAGTSAMQQGNLNKAIRIYRKILSKAPDFVAPRANLANCLLFSGRPEEAFRELKYAINLAPRDVDIWMTMARVYDFVDDAESEIRVYQKILQIDPNHIGAMNNLGATYRMERQFDLAEQWLVRALKQIEVEGELGAVLGAGNSEKLGILENLAKTYQGKGDMEKSIEYWRQCVSLDPFNSEFRQSLQIVEEKKEIRDTISPIRLADGRLAAPEGYSFMLHSDNASIKDPGPIKEDNWLKLGYEIELV